MSMDWANDGKDNVVMTDNSPENLRETEALLQTLRTSEQAAREFQQKLKALHEVNVTLSKVNDLDELCRRSIELGRSRLGFDRLGLFLMEDDKETVRGTFGTDTQGRLRDERDLHWKLSHDARLIEVLQCQERIAVWHDTPLLDNWQEVGHGWNAMAVLWSGERALGWLAADNLLSQSPLAAYTLELLSLYATTLGHLITQKQAEKDLAQLKQAIEFMQLGVTITDLDGTIVYTNQAEAEMHGYRVEELLGQRSCLFAPQELRTPLVLREVERWNGLVRESVNIRKDGTTFPVRLMSEIVRGSDGSPCAIITSCEDITERKALEAEREQYRNHLEELVKERTTELTTTNAQLRQEIREHHRTEKKLIQAKEAALEAKNTALEAQRTALEAQRTAEAAQKSAEAANRAKSEFLASMSHELRTPLNAILGFSQILAHEQVLDGEYQEYLETINRNGEHLLTLVNQVLDLSKIEADRMTTDEHVFNLYHFLDELESIFALRAEEKQVQLHVQREQSVPEYVRTDEVKLRQVLINLLNNAIKFTQQGEVTLHVKKLDTRNLKLNEQNSSAETTFQDPAFSLRFQISDTGPGIDPDEVDRIFEAFVQAKNGRKSGQGTGLGLTISQKFVQLLGSTIQVESEPGKGTTFRFDIPVQLADSESINKQQMNQSQRVLDVTPDQPVYRILIVDDNPDSRQLLVKLLTCPGFEVQEAEHGQAGIEMWKAWDPHLIFMDMRMPILNGYRATQRIRELETRQSNPPHPASSIQYPASVPIIALTASTLEEERQDILEVGCDDFLGKPLRESELYDMLQKYLGIRYRYEMPEKSNGTPTEASETPPLIMADALAVLPDEILQDLEQASIRLNAQQIDDIIETIARQNVELAHELAKFAKRFQYEQIFSWIKQAWALKTSTQRNE